MILHGDCLEQLKTLEDNSVDAVCTDPPYGLSAAKNSGKTSKGGFMGKHWDYDVPKVELWREVLRVLKPGGHLLSFGGTRTYHRLASAIEDAGFEIRDQIQWLYGSGFPKSLDISKAIDKAAGAEREVVGISQNVRPNSDRGNGLAHREYGKVWDSTAPATDQAKEWQGWGTALKPANEPIVLARKPLSESTVAKNVLKWGVGGLNIDATRIEGLSEKEMNRTPQRQTPKDKGIYGGGKGFIPKEEQPMFNPQGRWPSNVLLGCDCEGEIHGQMCAVHLLDEQSGALKSGALNRANIKAANKTYGVAPKERIFQYVPDSGGASRFFYVAKASKRERNAGMGEQVNGHPTVKPLKLMQYLIKLITPPSGLVLDPFAGSGSTGVAAVSLGFKFLGIEREAEYVEIATRRLKAAKPA